MEEKVIKPDVSIEKYFIDLPYTTKDRLHRYRKTEEITIDQWGRAKIPLTEDKRKGKIINNRCYKMLGGDSWELIAVKLPSGEIITTSKEIEKKLKKKCLMINNPDEWEREKELERVEKAMKEDSVKCIKDWVVLNAI